MKRTIRRADQQCGLARSSESTTSPARASIGTSDKSLFNKIYPFVIGRNGNNRDKLMLLKPASVVICRYFCVWAKAPPLHRQSAKARQDRPWLEQCLRRRARPRSRC